MCAMCHCTHKSHGLGNSDVHTWWRRTKPEFEDAAEWHRKAENEKAQKEIIDETGIQWTALLWLSYFDPSCFVVVDAMHNLFLGLIQEHFEILGIKLEGVEDKNAVIDISSSITPVFCACLISAEQKLMNCLIRILKQPMNSAFVTTEGSTYYKKKLMGCHVTCL